MNKIIIIDTTDNKRVKIGLRIGKKEFLEERPLDTRKAQMALPLIEKLLQENKLSLQDLNGIEVNPGPGSFTGIRVGLTLAHTLSSLLGISVNGKKLGDMVEPVY